MALKRYSQLFTKPLSRWQIILAASLTVAAAGLGTFYSFAPKSNRVPVQTTQTTSATPAPVKVAVTALGRLQPEGQVTYLSAPNSINGVRVEKLFVKEGDEVKAG